MGSLLFFYSLPSPPGSGYPPLRLRLLSGYRVAFGYSAQERYHQAEDHRYAKESSVLRTSVLGLRPAGVAPTGQPLHYVEMVSLITYAIERGV